jgi:hypothetical protein
VPGIARSALFRKVLMQPEPAHVPHDLSSVVKREEFAASAMERRPMDGSFPSGAIVPGIVQQNPHGLCKNSHRQAGHEHLVFQFEKSVFTPNSTQTSQRYCGNQFQFGWILTNPNGEDEVQ